MTAKHVILMLAVILLAGGIITWTGGMARRAAHPGPETPAVIPVTTADDPAERLTISWLGPPYFPNAGEGTWIERMLERRFNVDFKPVYTDNNAYTNRRPLMYCGGEVPEVAWEADPITVQRFARHGFLAQVPYALIKRYAPTYVKYMNEYAPVAWLYSTWNGKNYGVPTMYLAGRYPSCGVWRKDWLNAVGITKTPETLDEMHTALYRFRHNDPDCNGKQDTYGMTSDLKWWWDSFGEIYGAYGVMPFDWMLKDGQVVWGGIQPETRNVLALLRQWYSEGIIDPDFVTDTNYRTITTKLVTGRIGYQNDYGGDAMLFAPHTDHSYVTSLKQFHPEGQFTPGWLPVGPGGRGMRVWGSGGNILVFSTDVARHPAKCIRVLKMLEAMTVNEQFALESSAGEYGRQWVWKYRRLAPAGGMRFLPPYDDGNQANMQAMAGYGGGTNIGGFFCFTTISPARADKYLLPFSLQHRNTHCRTEWARTDLLGKPDVVPSSGEYMADLRNRQTTVFAEIIRGNKPLEAFDAFVAEWHRRGGDRMLAEARQLQEQKRTIYREVGVAEEMTER